MSTEAQLRANRLNAQKSTGPRTDAGTPSGGPLPKGSGMTKTRLNGSWYWPGALG